MKIHNDWLIRRTGDPFADVGGRVIEVLMEEKGTSEIVKLIAEACRIYVKEWKGKLNAFFLNSKITQPAFVGDRKIKETMSYYQRLLDETEPYEFGYCRIIGEQTKLFPGGRDNHILSGSSTFINFHHAFQPGLLLSKEALVRMFFVPLGCVQLSDKIALLDSNDEEVAKFFVRENVRENLRRSSTRIGDGVLRSGFRNPGSALFDFALHWVTRADDQAEDRDVELQLYHFSNFGASPEIVLYSFSANLFRFYARLRHRYTLEDWQRFANAHFRQKGATYLYETNTFEVIEKKQQTTVGYDTFKTWYNVIYDKLLKGESIRKYMLNWVSQQRRPLNFNIVKLYQILLRNMNEKTLQIIERIAEFVMQDENSLKKNLRELQKPNKAYIFRSALRKLEEKNLSQKNPEPLFSLQEYALELFPDGAYWQEVQELLLIAIYQKMHERGIWLDEGDLTPAEVEEETTEEN